MKNLNKRYAGTALILIPTVFFIFTYIRYECSAGRCSIPMGWMMVGFLLIIIGLVLLLSRNGEEEEDE